MAENITRALSMVRSSGERVAYIRDPGLSAWLAQVTALGRFWLEKRSVALAYRWFIAVATGRRGRKLLRKRSVCTEEFPARDNDAGVQQKSAARWFR